MLMGLAEHARCIPGTCLLPLAVPTHAEVSEADLSHLAAQLLTDLGHGADFRDVRDMAWGIAEAVREAEARGRLSRRRALALYDLLGACWSVGDRMARAWRGIEAGEPGGSLHKASDAGRRVDEIEAILGAPSPAVVHLRARIHALMQLADVLDEAAFLSDCGDPGGARTRATRALDGLAELRDLGRINPDEQDMTELAAARWGARPRG